ncbi:MAG TPA: thioredoxin-dependent thiol peroxidase [Polyangiaceae bacterium]
MAAKKTKSKPSAKPKASNASAKKSAPAKTAPAKPAKAASKAKSSSAVIEGAKAPAFSLGDETGTAVNSHSLAGKPYVLYFYPKDDTPGCTTEACDFRDNLRAFNNAKVRVIGVSPDDAKRHAKFKEKYGLTFTLLSDTDKELVNAYGVWVEKQNYGRSYMGVERSTFLVDKSGVVKKIWRKVRVAGHVASVLAAL